MASPNQPNFDPGLTQQYSDHLRRSINLDGSFNVRRRGMDLRNANLYLDLISMSWFRFMSLITGTFLLINAVFATLYLIIGIEHLKGSDRDNVPHAFSSAYFFSVHTLTTVGYGNVYPDGYAANLVAAFEAMIGLLGFALATGLLYGKFSRPSARILFSSNMLIAPYQDGTSLQFRVANKRNNVLMEMEATMLLMTVYSAGGELKRNYRELPLERRAVYFLPLTWTIVHPIDASSPLFGKSAEDLASEQAEVLILIKGFDDTFSQVVHARRSYRHDEILWGAKFVQIFQVEHASGDLILELNRIDEVQAASLSSRLPDPPELDVLE